MVSFIFWVLLLGIVYHYVAYPALLWIIAGIKRNRIVPPETTEFKVSLIIAAHNEKNCIRGKLKNSLDLDYPPDKLEIIVASDNSTDGTNEVVREFEPHGVVLLERKERTGKTGVQNAAAAMATGNILVFSDANAMYDRQAIRKLVRHFQDPLIGCVGGRLVYVSNSKKVSGENLYWRFENAIKQMEGKIISLLGVNGSIYALRKDIYVPLPLDIISDFVEPLKIFEKGYLVIYEKEAISYEDLEETEADEFKRKVRILTRSIYGLLYARQLMNPLRYGWFALQLISHKMLRFLVPLLLLLLPILNLFLLDQILYRSILEIQALFYGCALCGYWLNARGIRLSLFTIPYYFVMVNLSVCYGWRNIITGRKNVVWQSQRKPSNVL